MLLLGKNTEDVWGAVWEALATHKGLQEVAAIVNVGHSVAAPAIAGLLKLTGWSRDHLPLTGAHLSVTATSRSSQWEPLEPGAAVWPPGYRHLLHWCTKDTPENKAPQPVAAVMAGKNTEVARLFWSFNKMEVVDRLLPNRTKPDATRWGCRVAWDH